MGQSGDPRKKAEEVVRHLNGKKPPMDAVPVIDQVSQAQVVIGLTPAPDGGPQPIIQLSVPVTIEAGRIIAQHILDACDKADEIRAEANGLVVPRNPGLIIPQ